MTEKVVPDQHFVSAHDPASRQGCKQGAPAIAGILKKKEQRQQGKSATGMTSRKAPVLRFALVGLLISAKDAGVHTVATELTEVSGASDVGRILQSAYAGRNQNQRQKDYPHPALVGTEGG
ncbi:MAG TPA: hypothetical protein VMW70_10480 [Burkholderiales bacterium]|nr:hypothetical protein [Burkholderiales bacterium]